MNAGKSQTIEDQALATHSKLTRNGDSLPYTGNMQTTTSSKSVFALFDGHGGNGMSTKLVNELHLVIHQNLEDLLPRILEAWQEAKQATRETKVSFVGLDDIEELASYTWEANLEELITGCLESAFWMMDKAALASRREWKVAASNDTKKSIYSFQVSGGSTALVALFICDRLFLANTGDSRAVIYKSENEYMVNAINWNLWFRNNIDIQAHPLSTDFTPDQERRRLQEIASHRFQLIFV